VIGHPSGGLVAMVVAGRDLSAAAAIDAALFISALCCGPGPINPHISDGNYKQQLKNPG
jgi:hypothetical protein